MSETDALSEWFAVFPYERAKADQARLQAEMQVLSTKLYQLQEAIQLYERYHPNAAASIPAPEPEKPRPAVAERQTRPSLRESIKLLLSEEPSKEWHTDQLREQLVSRGLLRPDSTGKNNLFAMLSVMTRDRQIDRIRTGWYRLPESEDQEV